MAISEMTVIRYGMVKEQVFLLAGMLLMQCSASMRGWGVGRGGMWVDMIKLKRLKRREEEENLEEITFLCYNCC